MKYDLTRLNSNIDSSIDIDGDYEFSKDEMSGTDLINLECHIEGSITKNSMNNLHLSLSIDGTMILPCAVTLKPTKYPFKIDIDDDIEELIENEVSYTNSIDIYPIVWENILMEIPMRVVSEEAENYQANGDGWSFTTDEEEVSSPFDELKDLL